MTFSVKADRTADHCSVCIVTIVRMTTLETGAKGKDPTYTGSPTLKWTAVETNVGIICACLPLLRPILNKLIPWFAAERLRRGAETPTGYVISTANTDSSGINTIDSSQYSDPWSNTESKHGITTNETSMSTSESRSNSEEGFNRGIRKTTEVETRVEIGHHDDSNSFRDEKYEQRRKSREDVV